jgi:hypothetical protein
MKNPPQLHPDNEKWATSIYRGIVPAKNILHRDFAIAGAVVSSPSFVEVTSVYTEFDQEYHSSQPTQGTHLKLERTGSLHTSKATG